MHHAARVLTVRSNLVSNSIKFTEAGSVRIVTKLLYPRIESTPGFELDDPLRIAADNREKQEQTDDEERIERFASGDTEKGSIAMENWRQSRDLKEKEEEKRSHKAVVRVEIHDTGVGLKKQDVIE